ncbi:MAG: M4 family metallopeptidase [Allosphingosinicella sp.]
MGSTCRHVNCITPPHMLKQLMESAKPEVRQAALATLISTSRLRGERDVRGAMAGAFSSPSDGRRSIYDCRNGTNLASARLARSEGQGASADASVNRAFDGLGATRDFYLQVHSRNSIDGMGMRLDGYVHRGVRYNNAFWNGQQMVFGDGDGIIFTDFTASLDVIGHELTHGVTEFTAGLEYHNQPGALNESMSDVFGSLVKQWTNGQTADQADWLIGPEIFTPNIGADALRSMKSPGQAYDSPDLGKDPQPGHMDDYVQLPDTDDGDWGGVHINSGIPNKAFYLFATAVGGNAWEKCGHVWYETLRASNVTTQFQEFADTSFVKAGMLFGAGSVVQQALREAWEGVGIRVSGPVSIVTEAAVGGFEGGDAAVSLAKLTARIEALTKEVRALTDRVEGKKEMEVVGRRPTKTSR